MAKPSSSKKVARAASTGGGRTSRGSAPVAFYSVMALVVILGVVLTWTSREDLQDKRSGDKTPPVANQDHWHAAYGIWLCDKWAPAISDPKDPKGIHTHALEDGQGDGIIHIHPFVSRAAGKNATLRRFAEATGLKVTRTQIKPPGGKTFRNGDKCGKDEGEVQLYVDGERIEGDPLEYNFKRDRQQIVWAFAKEGENPGPPPSVAGLDNLSDVPGSGAGEGTGQTIPGVDPATGLPTDPAGTPPPGDPTATTAPGDPTATTAPADPSATTAPPATTATTAAP